MKSTFIFENLSPKSSFEDLTRYFLLLLSILSSFRSFVLQKSMAKMSTRSSPTKNADHNSPLKSQGLTKNPSMELCRFTDPEVDQLRPCFPDAITLSHIQESLITKERVEPFWKLDPTIRTFPLKSKDPEEISSISYTTSSAAKSSKSASRFSIADLQDIASPRSIKKELAVS
ncbi:hypothetical protein Hanom_Chr07g00617021 [Helianthus anomalus]